jgi:hypothetical protein
VGGCQAAGDLRSVINCSAQRDRPAVKTLTQRLAFVRRTPVRRHLVNRENVGMIQRRGSPRFLFEPGKRSGSALTDSGSTLIATSRFNRVSNAR